MPHRVLIVDDEPRILDALRRSLRGHYQIVTAESGAEGLDILQSAPPTEPFGVVISDMMMPQMNGAEFLARAREIAPDAVQMILSGQADLTSTIQAVNNGNLFRFLTKPCSAADLIRAIDDASRQYQLVTAERELLERTLHGAVGVLTEVLSLASPQAFSRGRAVTTLVEDVTEILGTSADWQLRLAAMLSQIGCIAIPTAVLKRAAKGTFLNAEEEGMYAEHPRLARDLLARIPRLESVAEWIGEQPTSPEDVDGEPLTGSAALFGATTAFLLGQERGEAPGDTARRLASSGRYPKEVLDALVQASTGLEYEGEVREILAHQVVEGMILDEDVRTTTGMVLVRRGGRITPTLAIRLANFSRTVGVVEPIRVIVE